MASRQRISGSPSKSKSLQFQSRMTRSLTLPSLDGSDSSSASGFAPKANYSRLKSGAIRMTPSNYHCKLFCGGVRCRYCDSSQWTDEEQAIPGLLSSWITDDLVASSRPLDRVMKDRKTIAHMKRKGINTVINLQKAGEHSRCGDGILDGGFSYDPEKLMAKDIYCYNFGWPDYGTTSISLLLDMVKVINFAAKSGKFYTAALQVLIHCHAGYGRTGVLIAVYLIWHYGWSPTEAIEYIRKKRPNCIQTEKQIQSLHEFSAYLKDLLRVFPKYYINFSDYMAQQNSVLHGIEARLFANVPKIIFVCCEYLLERGGVLPMGSVSKVLESVAKYSGNGGIVNSIKTITSQAFQNTWTKNLEHSNSLPDLTHLPIEDKLKIRHMTLHDSTPVKLPPIVHQTQSQDTTKIKIEIEEERLQSHKQYGEMKFIASPASFVTILEKFLNNPAESPNWTEYEAMQEDLLHRLRNWLNFVQHLTEFKALVIMEKMVHTLQIRLPEPNGIVEDGSLITVHYISAVFSSLLLQNYSPTLEKEISEVINKLFPQAY